MERRGEGPINGKLGFSLAVAKQFAPLIYIMFGVAMLFGFRFSTPAEDIRVIKAELAIIAPAVTALVRLECIRAMRDVNNEAQMAGLSCASLR